MNVKGHLFEYPLCDLLPILGNKRETGRLQIAFERAPGVFHLKDGRILDAALGPIKGLDAVRLALSMKEGASFDFDDTVAIAGVGTINESEHQQIISWLPGLLPHDDEDVESILLTMTSVTKAEDLNPPATNRLAVSERIQAYTLFAVRETLNFARTHTLAFGVAGILMLLVPIVIATAISVASNDGSRAAALHMAESDIHRADQANSAGGGSAHQGARAVLPADAARFTAQRPAAIPQPTVWPRPVSVSSATAELSSPGEKEPVLRNENAPPEKTASRVIAVVMRIEQGRISEAYVRNHRPGLEAFEATAIRLARQRRYSTDKVGTETIFVTVSKDQ